MKKLPYGISDYDRLIEGNYYYVDKTKYIEKLENLSEIYVMFLRPRKFGKTLFTSVLENYYDVKKKNKFDEVFGKTYIGKNPTKLKNSYYILRFNFSGISAKDEETTLDGFKEKVIESIQLYRKSTNETDRSFLKYKINNITKDIDKINSKIQTCKRIIATAEKGEKENLLIKKRG